MDTSLINEICDIIPKNESRTTNSEKNQNQNINEYNNNPEIAKYLSK